METYLASVAANLQQGSLNPGEKPIDARSEAVGAARAGGQPSSEPNPGVKVSFSPAAAQIAQNAAWQQRVSETRSDGTERRPQQEAASPRPEQDLSSQERQELSELRRRDQEIRTREAAQMAAAGQLAGALQLEYETGPDGQRYAVDAKVQLDTTEPPTPEMALTKARALRTAALRSSQSSNGSSLMAKANALEAKAKAEVQRSQAQASAEVPAGLKEPASSLPSSGLEQAPGSSQSAESADSADSGESSRDMSAALQSAYGQR